MEAQSSQLAQELDSQVGPHSLPSRRIRVLIDARKIGDGGIGVYIENLIRGLGQFESCSISAIVNPEKTSQNILHDSVKLIEDRAPLYSFDELWRMPQRINFSKYDVFHTPHYLLPFRIPIPTIITVHDLIHLQCPERAFYPFIAKPLIHSSLRRASRIFTVSRSSCEAIKRLAPDVSSKIRVIPNAIDPELVKEARPREFICNRFGLRPNYLLAVFSNAKPHKGLSDLITAFSNAKEALQGLRLFDGGERAHWSRGVCDLRLVLVGIGTEDLVGRPGILSAIGNNKSIHVLGRVTKEELRSLYSNALALVVPSIQEGFCLPALEAKAVGTPVIARPVAAIRELLDGEDVVCEDMSVQALRCGIIDYLKEYVRCQVTNISRRGVSRSFLANFSRSAVTERVWQAYQELLDP